MNDELDRLTVDGTDYTTEVPENSITSYQGLPDPTEIRAFIPGTIVDVRVRVDDMVRPGDILLLLDAMKMHNEICSGISGRVREIHVEPGDTVVKDQLLVSLRKG